MDESAVVFLCAAYATLHLLTGVIYFVGHKMISPKSTLSWWELPRFMFFWGIYLLEGLDARNTPK